MDPIVSLIVGAALAGVPAVVREVYFRGLNKKDAAVIVTNARLDALEATLHASREELVALKTQQASQSPFFSALQSKLIDALHHPDPASAELDHLLEKLRALTLASDELERLEVLLIAQTLDETLPLAERQQSRALLAVMPLVLEEAKQDVVGSEWASRPAAGEVARPDALGVLTLQPERRSPGVWAEDHQPAALSRGGLMHQPDRAAEALVMLTKDTNQVAHETRSMVAELQARRRGDR